MEKAGGGVPIRLIRVPGSFSVCRFEPRTEVALPSGPLVSLTQTPEEVSLVCLSSRVSALPDKPIAVEKGFACLKVVGPLPFDATGIMARLTQPLAGAGISVFAISTYDTDYLLFSEDQFQEVLTTLNSADANIRYVTVESDGSI